MASWITGAVARRYNSSTRLVHRVASRRHTSTTTSQSVGGSHSCPNPLSHSPRLIRRELSSLFPVHSAVSSARLVSRLAVDASFSAEGAVGMGQSRKKKKEKYRNVQPETLPP